jgi:hypothetical protein
MSENRRFGCLMAFFLAAWTGAHFWRTKSIAIAPIIATVLVLFMALIFPNWLELPRKAWLKLGEILGHINQPIVLGILFFFIITPMGLLRRFLGHSKLDWRTGNNDWKNGRSTYWHRQEDSSQTTDPKYNWKSLRRQF